MISNPLEIQHRRPELLHRSVSHGVHILAAAGAATCELLAQLCDALDDVAGESVIVDISDVILCDSATVRDLVALLTLDEDEASFCIVSRRVTSRAVVRKMGGTHLPLFGSVGDAMEAKLLERDGYGPGWAQHTRHAVTDHER